MYIKPVLIRRFGSKKIHLWPLKGIKPIISGSNRKCVGEPKNNNHI